MSHPIAVEPSSGFERFSIEEAERLASHHFARQGRATRLPGYADENFRIEADDGQNWILKIAARDVTEADLDFQNMAMRHIAERLTDVTSSQPMPTVDGEYLASTVDADGEKRWLRMLSWLPGVRWTEHEEHSDALLLELGETLADLDIALMDFVHPRACKELDWDLRRVTDLWPLTPLVQDSRRRAIVEHFLFALETEALPRLATTRRSIIHNDANEQNVLIASKEDGNVEIAGIIDFGDIVLSHTVCELAIAGSYVLLQAGDLAALEPLVAGYHRRLPLTEDEIDLLYLLIAGRLVNSVLKSTEGILANPNNRYLVISQSGAWQALDLLMSITPEEAVNRFRQACGIAPRVLSSQAPEELSRARHRHFGRNLSLSYQAPLTILRGSRQYLFDERGRAYLDLVNNVCHVGHAHPRVVRALSQQAAVLNTNTRYLHPVLVDYISRLTDVLPDPLNVVFLCCTGSEANDLALRLARNYTERHELVVVDAAYHGHTAALIEASPYKFDSAGGPGRRPHIHVVPSPDVYRGPHRGASAAADYAEHVRQALSTAETSGGAAAFIVESLLGCGGQIEPPAGYLQQAFAHTRQAGAVCIADEVQVGFGRAGTHMWGFEAQGAVPDIVTLGKPIGNGHPLAAVVTTVEIAEAFDNGMEYFNTFGGNPVSCAVGRAVLDVVQDEGLQENALQVGNHFLAGLRDIAQRHPLIGDVRGRGLFLGVELVRDPDSLEPAAEEAAQVIEAMKEAGILLSTDGPLHNVLKIKPPLVVTRSDVDRVVETLDQVLGTLHMPN